MHSSKVNSKINLTGGKTVKQTEANPPSKVLGKVLKTEPKRQTQTDAGIVARIVMVVALSLTLVGVLRWAMGVTNANARQVSTNLSRIQGAMDDPAHPSGTESETKSASGPSLEPAEGRNGR